MCQFTLKPDALEWQIGRRSGRVRYDRVRAVRLSYRPVTMQTHRFITEIWSADNPKIQIVSVSWRSIMEQERLDKAYSAFVTELHRRVSARGRAGEVHDRPAGRDLLGRRRHLQRRSCSRPAACSCARCSSVQWARHRGRRDILSGVCLSARHLFLSQPAGPLSPRRHPARASCRRPNPSPWPANPA